MTREKSHLTHPPHTSQKRARPSDFVLRVLLRISSCSGCTTVVRGVS
ncbi:hypothetical protein CpipJ_CPIJ014444 [Culex quinquefasciatus]|uniref:Uncharacterized protein n=1 Tax=Culex quinquefasciatus TaxID=7176 RepID=B0X4L4_CULQU|nr:hypothetical protein CpipJ_CPIJ014444 [Culex quinquefasciatus]|eukprot:XP_001864586.1 hypothetical protein CpipJ_CPIJ014444 [Culex quinquefasciatus]